MPSSKKDKQPEGTSDAEIQGGVPSIMVQQASAAAASENDPSDETAAQKKHQGHDVPTRQQSDLEPGHDELPDHPPPSYGEHFGSMTQEQDGFNTQAQVAEDGRVNINIQQTSKKLSNLLVPALRHQQEVTTQEHAPPPAYIPPSLGGEAGVPPPPPMNVVVQVVGSRGDVQPFVALGKVLKEEYGHRVRLATHPVFQDFIKENGLECFSIGGDPAQLMAFMVKSPGLMPGFDTLRSGDVGMRRKEVGTYIKGCWRSCFESGDGLGPEVNDNTVEDYSNTNNLDQDLASKPFVADCIIANPPSFAHVHCAEKLGIPLHIMFTMPYSPTQAFPHPLANIQSSNTDPHLANYMSYALIDMLTWQGLGDVINRFRSKSLGLEPISLVWAPGMLQRLGIPHTYCWSPALIPKPKDWGQKIQISGFFFLNLASNYTPAPDLKAFLDAGPPPVYIGFGSIVLDDPNKMTEMIFEAVRITGQRVLLSKGWGGMGAEEMGVPEGVFMLGNVPHDWLFERVSAVVHHGGAGTTAAGITAGKPTVVVPFFGDQPFWGSMVARAGAGPEPLPHKELTAQKLADAIDFCLKPESQSKAKELASKIAKEKGTQVGAQSFHQQLDVDKLRCALVPSRPAVWRLKRTQVRLSALAACTLANAGLLEFNDLKLFRPKEYETDEGPWDPITGGATALVGTISTMMMGVADFPIETLKALKIHPDAAKKKQKSKEGSGDDGTSSVAESSGSAAAKSSSDGKETPSTRDSMASDERTLASPQSGASTPATSTARSGSSFNFQESMDKLQKQFNPNEIRKDSTKSGDGKQQSSSSADRPRSPGFSHLADTVTDTSKGINKIVGAGFKSPLDFTMAVTKGFQNAPKLYGDETVRKSDNVTDLKSGLRQASKGFGYGLYDGITGLVTQPLSGAKKEGAAGFLKGMGKGFGGIVFKPAAGGMGVAGYVMKGVYSELNNHFGSSVQNYIIAARTAQGYDEWVNTTETEREGVVVRWKALQGDIKKKRNVDEIVREALDEQRRKGREWRTGLRDGWERRRSSCRGGNGSGENTPGGAGSSRGQGGAGGGGEEQRDLEEAIRLSVRQTSKGNEDEDVAVERAIKASMAELQRNRAQKAQQQKPDLPPRGGEGDGDDDEDFRRAIEASMAEAEAGAGGGERKDPVFDEELERALAASLKEEKKRHDKDGDWDDDEDDEEYKQAIAASQAQAESSSSQAPPPAGKETDAGRHLAGTTHAEFEESRAGVGGGGGGGEKTQQERSEEEIVMEYVKKQSLLEEEARKGRSGAGEKS